MSACEKCWGDAYSDAHWLGGSQVAHYHRLLAERRGNPCSEAEQRGTRSEERPSCEVGDEVAPCDTHAANVGVTGRRDGHPLRASSSGETRQ